MNTSILLILLVPIVEIYLFIKIGSQIGAFNTISLIVITAVIGLYYAKYEGLNTLRSALNQLVKNELPVYEIISGAALAFAALLMILPGFLTDVIGLLIIFPWTRKLLFKKFSKKKILSEKFPRIKFDDAILKYGTDKPDLRNPLEICDLTSIFRREDVKFEIFKKLVNKGSIVRAIVTKKTSDKPRSFFDNLDKWAKEEGAGGLAYFTFEKNEKISAKGPVGKFFSEDSLKEIIKISDAEPGDSIFFACNNKKEVIKLLSAARDKLAVDLNLIDENSFSFCWIIDYPMFEVDKITGKITFSHNPFSMPQIDEEKIDFSKPLNIKAFQYDIVCNGVELSSGAIRNHKPDLMYKLFSIAGYNKKDVDEKFKGMINALSYGAPPHGGIAPGIDRIVMLLAEEKNIREVTLFPLNQNAQDLMMGAPSKVDQKQLKELNIKNIDLED